jgi:hypothetical protein
MGLVRDQSGTIPAFPIHADTFDGTPTSNKQMTGIEPFIVLMMADGDLTITFPAPTGEKTYSLEKNMAVAVDKTATDVRSTARVLIS